MVQHLMETKRTGKIINISSVHEELPFPNFCLLRQQRWMKMLTRNLAVELGPLGITINNGTRGDRNSINTKLLNDPEKLGCC